MSPFLAVNSILYAWEKSDAPGKGIIIVQLVISVLAWTVMLTKAQVLRAVSREDRLFKEQLRRQPNCMALVGRKLVLGLSPMLRIYNAGAAKLLGSHSAADLERGRPGRLPLNQSDIDAACAMMDRTAVEEGFRLESQMAILAMAVSVSPLLGLLGTVWGVMNAFAEAAFAQSATIPTVAPGISSAILTTVVGLLVAIPSLVAYNLLSGQIRIIKVQIENFIDEFSEDLDRAFESSPRSPPVDSPDSPCAERPT